MHKMIRLGPLEQRVLLGIPRLYPDGRAIYFVSAATDTTGGCPSG